MYTAKVQNKAMNNGVLTINVVFSDGTTSIMESCQPSNDDNFKNWVQGRLNQLNAGPVVASKYNDGDVVDLTHPAPVTPTMTAADIAQQAWFKNYYKWTKIKTTLIDTGILTGNEPKLVALKAKVISDFLPAYIDVL